MGRIRTLKPEILEDDRTASLSDSSFRLFVALILLADDHGNVRADERWLDGQVWWAQDTARGDSRKSAASLRELSGQGLVLVYAVRDQLYVSIRGWKKHQRIDNAGKPRVPQSSDPEAEILPQFAATRGETPLYLRPPTTTTSTSTEGECEGKRALPSASQLALTAGDSEGLTELKLKVDRATGDVGKQRARKPRPTDPTAAERAIALRVLGRLTAHNGVAYRSEGHVKLVADRLRDGVTEAELRAIVNYCALDLKWATDDRERMGKCLRPSTLFGPITHVKYLDEARAEYAEHIAAFKPPADEPPPLALVPEAG